MTKRRAVAIADFVPAGCVLLDSYTTPADTVISVGDKIQVWIRGFEGYSDVKVRKIIAEKDSGEVRELEVITIKDPQFRTVKPNQERKTMKVSGYKGDLPKRTGGGRTRAENPFDEHIAKSGTHQVHLDADDDPVKVKRQIQSAARFADKGVKVATAEDGSIIFAVLAERTKRARKPKTTAA